MALDPDINQGVGTGGLNARQQFVGLAGNFGTVALGRQYAPGFNATARNDALDASDMAIQSSLSALNGYTITPNSPARFNNSITYTSNNLSGFTVSAIYGFGETGDGFGGFNDRIVSTSDNGKLGFGLNYANGPDQPRRSLSEPPKRHAGGVPGGRGQGYQRVVCGRQLGLQGRQALR
jgi:predicted porin